MATGFGFCPNCGAAIGAAGQRFCPGCGATLPAIAAAPAAVPVPPQAPVYAPPPAGAYAPPPQWGPPPGAPVAAPARAAGSPTTLLVGGVIIAAIVGVAFFAMNNGSKGSPGSSGSPAHSGANNSAQPGLGSIVFSPATISCPSQPFATTIHLPSSLKGTDTITYRIDDTDIIAQTVAEFGLTQQPDGTWSLSDTNPNGSSHCDMGPGAHIARLVDASGKVLAQGSFTFVMSATPSPTRKPTPRPTPTPAPLDQGSLTFAPASMSCSADSVSVTLTAKLPASIAADAMLTSEVDGVTGSSARTDANFTQQPDGSWLSTGPTDSSSLCGSFDQGEHTFRILDADGNVLAEGSFTLLP